MKHISTFMGHTTEYDPVIDRRNLQARAERGEITPIGYWANLKAAWYQMTTADKKEELAEIDN